MSRRENLTEDLYRTLADCTGNEALECVVCGSRCSVAKRDCCNTWEDEPHNPRCSRDPDQKVVL